MPINKSSKDAPPPIVTKKVAKSDLQNGMLLNPKQIKQATDWLAKNNQKKMKKGTYVDDHGRKFVMPFSVMLSQEGQLYGLYRGRKHGSELGKGAFGSVKLTQNLVTGDWAALKTQKIDINTNMTAFKKAEIRKEQDMQQDMQQIIGRQSLSTKNPFQEKSMTIMPLFSAAEFAKQESNFNQRINNIDANRNPEIHRQEALDTMLFSTNAAKTTLQQLHTLHNKGIIHRDLHTGNILVDPKGNATIIDFGCGQRTNEGPSRVAGRSDTNSPEEHWAAQSGQLIQYTPKCDMYAIGNCVDKYQTGQLLAKYGQYLNIPLPELNHSLLMLTNLRNINPNARPSAGQMEPVLGRMHDYIKLQKGIDMRSASKGEIEAYFKLAERVGNGTPDGLYPTNGKSAINVINKNGHKRVGDDAKASMNNQLANIGSRLVNQLNTVLGSKPLGNEAKSYQIPPKGSPAVISSSNKENKGGFFKNLSSPRSLKQDTEVLPPRKKI